MLLWSSVVCESNDIYCSVRLLADAHIPQNRIFRNACGSRSFPGRRGCHQLRTAGVHPTGSYQQKITSCMQRDNVSSSASLCPFGDHLPRARIDLTCATYDANGNHYLKTTQDGADYLVSFTDPVTTQDVGGLTLLSLKSELTMLAALVLIPLDTI